MFTAIRDVVPSHLCDSEPVDFKIINSNSGVINGGDTAFDDEPLLAMKLANDANKAVNDFCWSEYGAIVEKKFVSRLIFI
jgi:tRNA 2-thiocytidine biosynthesis protein TtcA